MRKMAKRRKTEGTTSSDPQWNKAVRNTKKKFKDALPDGVNLDKMMLEKLKVSATTTRPMGVACMVHFTVGEVVRDEKGNVKDRLMLGDAVMELPNNPMKMPESFKTFFALLRTAGQGHAHAIAGGHICLHLSDGTHIDHEAGVPVGDDWKGKDNRTGKDMTVEEIAMLTFGSDLLDLAHRIITDDKDGNAFYWLAGCSVSFISYVSPDSQISKTMNGVDQ